jgi:hypothetical protein
MSIQSPPACAVPGAIPATLLVLVLTGLAAAGPACGQRTSSAAYSFVRVDSDGGGAATIDGVTFEFDASVRFLYVTESTSPGSSTNRATVDGHDFGLRDGQIFVGERTYGPASSGTTVRITRAGVTVGGEQRGALPDPRQQ